MIVTYCYALVCEGVIVSSRQMSKFSAISWQEQVTFNEMMSALYQTNMLR